MDTSKANPDLLAALSVAQGEIENADKNAQNPHFRSSYADLAEVLNTIRPVFSRNGLALLQSTEFFEGVVSVCTLIAHKSGGMVSSVASCVPAKTDAQGIGAATTYLRRYGAAAMAGISQEDDDGNAASHSNQPNRQERPAHPALRPKISNEQPGEHKAPAAISDAQHRHLEVLLSERGLPRERVRAWLASKYADSYPDGIHFNSLLVPHFDDLLRNIPRFEASMKRESEQ